MDSFIQMLISGNNFPPPGSCVFDSTDHVRFENGIAVTGHNFGCNRRIVIEKNIEGDLGYTVTMYNQDGVHPFWQDNVQMAPKKMKIESISENIVVLRGYGFDSLGAAFSNYGIMLLIEDGVIQRVQLNMYDRNISIVYLK